MVDHGYYVEDPYSTPKILGSRLCCCCCILGIRIEAWECWCARERPKIANERGGERDRENIILLNGKYENKEKTPKMFLF